MRVLGTAPLPPWDHSGRPASKVHAGLREDDQSAVEHREGEVLEKRHHGLLREDRSSPRLPPGARSRQRQPTIAGMGPLQRSGAPKVLPSTPMAFMIVTNASL